MIALHKARTLLIVAGIMILLNISGCTWPMSSHAKYKQMMRQYDEAMKQGRAKDAIHWSQQILEISKDIYIPPHRGLYLGNALELSGDYEEALKVYLAIYDKTAGSRPLTFDVGRVYFKMKLRKEAFAAYCDEITESMIQADSIRDAIVGKEGFHPDNPLLFPFENYQAFMEFIETEYRDIDNKEKYQKAIEIFRDVTKKLPASELNRGFFVKSRPCPTDASVHRLSDDPKMEPETAKPEQK